MNHTGHRAIPHGGRRSELTDTRNLDRFVRCRGRGNQVDVNDRRPTGQSSSPWRADSRHPSVAMGLVHPKADMFRRR